MVNELFTMLGAGIVGYAGYGIIEAVKDVRSYYKATLEEEYRVSIEEPVISSHELVLGYKQFGGYRKPIIADMQRMPHVLVCGLSRQGKTKMIEYSIQNKNVILLNTDKRDFPCVKCERINDIKEIEVVLQKLVEIQENNEPIYVVIDEILALIKSGSGKKIMDLITQLLAVGSHKNIYVIAITQCAEKEIVNNKHLYNIRVCFKMLDESAYKVVLGKAPEDLYLCNRQFYYITDEIGTGYTYDVGK